MVRRNFRGETGSVIGPSNWGPGRYSYAPYDRPRLLPRDLYTGLEAPSGDGATDFAPYRNIAAKLVDATVDADIAAVADYLRSTPTGGKASASPVFAWAAASRCAKPSTTKCSRPSLFSTQGAVWDRWQCGSHHADRSGLRR